MKSKIFKPFNLFLIFAILIIFIFTPNIISRFKTTTNSFNSKPETKVDKAINNTNESPLTSNKKTYEWGVIQLENDSSKLNVRKNEFDSSEIIGNLPNGAIIDILDEKDDLYKINYNNITGYVKKDFITKGNPNVKTDKNDLSSTIKEGYIRYYAQDDPRYGNTVYTHPEVNNKNQLISNSACGPSAFATVVSTLNKKNISPVELCKYSLAINTRTYNNGTNSDFFDIACNDSSKPNYNLNCYSTTNTKTVQKALKDNNHLIIVNMKRGHVSKGGHYIILSGTKKINNESYFKVYDPHCYNQYYIYDDSLIDENKNDGFILLKQSTVFKEAHIFYIFSKK